MRLTISSEFAITWPPIGQRAARRIAIDILRAVDGLDTFPNRGRPGRVEETRELVLAPLPFVAVYEVLENEVQVLRILHGAQQWPPP